MLEGATEVRPGRLVTDAERRARLGVRQALASPVADAEAATRAVVCLHATEPANLYLSAAARSGADRPAIARALYDDRSVVRQLAMRRTVFALPVDLLPAVRGSASARVAAQVSARLAKEVEAEGIASDGPAWVATTGAEVLGALGRGPATSATLRATVPELARRLHVPGSGAAGVPVGPRLLSVLAADGSVVRGHNDGGWRTSRPFWTRIAEWLGADPGAFDVAAGYAEVVNRWLWAFGPGTEDDLAWWLGATRGAVRNALAAVGAVPVVLEDGTRGWLRPDDLDVVADPPSWVALLPALDPTTMGWKQRHWYLGGHATAIFDRNGNGGPTAWCDGRIVGGWTQDEEGRVVVVPLGTLPRGSRRPLDHCAEELTAWLAGDVVRSVYQSPLVRARVDAPR